MKYFKYLKYILRHKWFVMIACFKQKLYWQGLVHDISKFRPSEFIPYANYFYGNQQNDKDKLLNNYRKNNVTSDKRFDYAWLLHLKRNPHHWQFWVLPEETTNNRSQILEIPDKYLKEMLCDWHGAGQAQGRKTSDFEWYQVNKNKMQLHSKSSEFIFNMLIPEGYIIIE